MTPAEARLARQFAFLNEIDKLKSVLRASELIDNSRFENSAEHSWHICLYALVLADQAGEDVNISRVIKMLLLHDIVEIDAGDHPIHAPVDEKAVAVIESAAAVRIFGLLPDDQRDDFHSLWREFEAAQTADAIFAKSVDRVAPVLQNLACGGGSWDKYNVTRDQLETRVGTKVARGAPAVWAYVKASVAQHFSDKASAAAD